MKPLAPILIVATLAGSAQAQERAPAQRQTLDELAYVLGESHALRQVCLGATDQYWRDRMSQLLAQETPEEGFDRALRENFNTGYSSAQAQFPICDERARAQAAAVARRGAALAGAAGN
jgi:uncharacterized protein (TIGR02301 family)